MHTTVDSVLIHSPDPARLRDWYVSITGGTPEGDALVHLGDSHLVIVGHDEIDGPSAEPARVMINLAVGNLHAERARLDQIGVNWIRPVSVAPFGLISTVADPDGNYVQLVQHIPADETAGSPT